MIFFVLWDTMHHVFLDTNIFLHFLDYDQIDWKKLLGTDETISIVFSPIVISELDKHKYNKNAKIARRVKRLLPKIEAALESDTSDGNIALVAISNIPADETFAANGLSKQEPDDNLLASLLEYSAANPQHSISFFTNDTTPRLKAKRLKIDVNKPPEAYLLPNEPDEMELQNRELKKELEEYKNRMPVVGLTFANKETLLVKELVPKEALLTKQQYIEREVTAIKLKHPRVVYFDYRKVKGEGGYDAAFRAAALSLMGGPTEHQVIAYNNELEEYYKDYAVAMEERYERMLFELYTISIELMLDNSGTAPAEDIDVELHFPDGFKMFDDDGLPKKVSIPDPPYLPKHPLDLTGFKSISPLLPIFSGINQASRGVPNVSSPRIKKTNSYNVDFKVKTLKHNQPIKLDMLYAHYDDIYQAKGFAIDYKMKVANLTRMVTGQLHVNIKLKKKDQTAND